MIKVVRTSSLFVRMRSAEGGSAEGRCVGLLLLLECRVVRTLLVLVDSACTDAVCMVNGKKR